MARPVEGPCGGSENGGSGGSAAKILSAEEDAIYDRQIRVWGVEAQCAIRSSRIAVVVTTDGGREEPASKDQGRVKRAKITRRQLVAAELVKNLALAGIGDLNIHLTHPGACDFGFLGRLGSDLRESLSGMNPRMKLAITEGGLDGETSLHIARNFDIIIVFGSGLLSVNRVHEALAAHHAASPLKAIFGASVRGGCGFAFLRRRQQQPAEGFGTSLMEALQVPRGNLSHRMNKLYDVLRAALQCELKLGRSPSLEGADANADADAMTSICSSIPDERHKPPQTLVDAYLEPSELPAAAAVVGGTLAQEVIKCVSGKGELMCNLFLFSACGSHDSGEGKVETVLTSHDGSAKESTARVSNDASTPENVS